MVFGYLHYRRPRYYTGIDFFIVTFMTWLVVSLSFMILVKPSAF